MKKKLKYDDKKSRINFSTRLKMNKSEFFFKEVSLRQLRG